MTKKNIFLVSALLVVQLVSSQTIFSDRFSTYTLNAFNNGSVTTTYSTIPQNYSLINDGRNNNIGTIYNPNAPFNVAGFKKTGWALVKNNSENDTFLVSTSWFDTITNPANRWIISPPIAVTTNNMLTWLAKSADYVYPEKYEVYVTNKTGSLTPNDFTTADRFFETAALNLNLQGGENPYWTSRAVNLSSFSGQTIRFAFRNISLDKYQLWIDDIKILQVNTSLDAKVIASNFNKFNLTTGSSPVGIVIENLGSTPITNCFINYKVGNSSIQSQSVSFSPPLTYSEVRSQSFTGLIALTTASLYPLKCWVSNVNGQVDNNSSNDSTSSFISFQSSKPRKSVLVEQFVSAFDPQTPEGQNKLETLQNDSVVVVNLHCNDSIKTPGLNLIVSDYKKNTTTALIDRQYLPSLETYATLPQNYQAQINSRLGSVSPASVSIINKNYNTGTRELSFTVKADFIGSVIGDYRLNAYLTENLVTGFMPDTSLNGFNQVSGFYNVSWSAYYQKGYYNTQINAHILNSNLYKHQNTLIHTFDSPYGVTGTPANAPVLAGTSITKTYSYTLPTTTVNVNKFIADNIYIVAYLAENSYEANFRNIINVAKTKLTANAEVVGVGEFLYKNKLVSVFPNPSNGKFYVTSLNKFKHIEVLDLLGKTVFSQEHTNTQNFISIDLGAITTGTYLLKCISEGSIEIKKIVVSE